MTAATNADGIAILNFIANSVSGTYNAIDRLLKAQDDRAFSTA